MRNRASVVNHPHLEEKAASHSGFLYLLQPKATPSTGRLLPGNWRPAREERIGGEARGDSRQHAEHGGIVRTDYAAEYLAEVHDNYE
jgi:hypothetical protein